MTEKKPLTQSYEPVSNEPPKPITAVTALYWHQLQKATGRENSLRDEKETLQRNIDDLQKRCACKDTRVARLEERLVSIRRVKRRTTAIITLLVFLASAFVSIALATQAGDTGNPDSTNGWAWWFGGGAIVLLLVAIVFSLLPHDSED